MGPQARAPFLALLLAAAPAPGDGPGGVWEIGDVDEDAVPARTFLLENPSETPLRILSVGTRCGCVTALPPVRVVPPKGRIEVPVTFRPEGLEGEQTTAVVLRTDDPARPEIRWTVRARIRERVRVLPDRNRYLGALRRGDPREAEMILLPGADAGTDAIEEASPVAPPPDLRIRTAPAKHDGKRGVALSISLRPEHPAGEFSHAFSVAVRMGGATRTVRLFATGYVEGSIVARQPRYELGPVRRSEFPPIDILVGSPREEPFRVLGVETGPRLEAETAAAEIPGSVRVRVRLKPGAAPGPFGEDVRISTDHPADPLLSVPVTGVLVPDWTVAPAEALLRLDRKEPGADVSVVLGEAVSPADVRLEAPADAPFTADVHPREGAPDRKARAFLVRVFGRAEAREPYAARLRLQVGAGGAAYEIPIPVRGVR